MANIVPPEFQQFVEEQFASGRYQSVDAVVSDGLRLLQDREKRYQELRAEIQAAVNRLDNGEGIGSEGDDALKAFFDQIMSEVDAELAAAE